jgi:hypothetical protein
VLDDPLAWPWSSARAHVGLERPRIPLAESDLRAAFGDADDWRERYRSTIDEPENDTAPSADPCSTPCRRTLVALRYFERVDGLPRRRSRGFTGFFVSADTPMSCRFR